MKAEMCSSSRRPGVRESDQLHRSNPYWRSTKLYRGALPRQQHKPQRSIAASIAGGANRLLHSRTTTWVPRLEVHTLEESKSAPSQPSVETAIMLEAFLCSTAVMDMTLGITWSPRRRMGKRFFWIG